ncbi:MAG TPA: hypothetical protein VM715_04070, partial [Candidatus Acidoferrum sp.]|nr:hypothetical protein [Candidatus Acidoferrum sp.]
MTEIASVQPLPWPAEKYIELADQFAQEAVQMRTTAMHILEQADRLSAASAELRKSAKFVDIPAAEELSQLRITTRRERVRIDPTQIRGFAQSYGDWFQMKQLQEVVPGSRSQLIRYVNELVEKGTLEARGYKRRRKYRFIKPEGNSGPFVAPRGEPSITQ